MKLLLDENLPHDLRHFIPGHDVFTVAFMGWGGIANGQLLALAAGQGFDALITLDSGIFHQQNPATLPCSVVIIKVKSNKLSDIQPLLTELLNALASLAPQTVVEVG
jgi:predicted nuclease of predicted toxin-antitoxin system